MRLRRRGLGLGVFGRGEEAGESGADGAGFSVDGGPADGDALDPDGFAVAAGEADGEGIVDVDRFGEMKTDAVRGEVNDRGLHRFGVLVAVEADQGNSQCGAEAGRGARFGSARSRGEGGTARQFLEDLLWQIHDHPVSTPRPCRDGSSVVIIGWARGATLAASPFGQERAASEHCVATVREVEGVNRLTEAHVRAVGDSPAFCH